MSSRYNHREAEPKWQARWAEADAFAARDDADAKGRAKYYVLEMFPYPSGKMHIGHVRNYTMGDVLARFKRARGFNVLHPMGWDAFGLPAENAAMERGIHPAKWTYDNIAAMRRQMQSMGFSIDWSREFATCDPAYYAQEQALFLDFLEKGFVERRKSYVNWDPVENTVLANEQVVDGCGWRSGAPVERRELTQWFLTISDRADELLAGLETLKRWPDKVRLMQQNWIGRSEGAHIRFALEGAVPAGQDTLEVFSTRPDTLYGASFCAISPGHPLTAALAHSDAALAAFVTECNRIGTSEAAIETAEKKGFDTGLRARHPFKDGETLPVYVANFVLMDYGTGAVFGCPAHDQRDMEFARKYGLPVIPVVAPKAANGSPDMAVAQSVGAGEEAFTGDGVLINSGFLDGLGVQEAKRAAIEKLEGLKIGIGTTTYRLRDWGISRQRYWGCPIPVVHCDACGVVPVPKADLPITLPDDVSFDKPGNPLDHHPTWKQTVCPTCGKPARRETDTFDTFVDSSWYFARFCAPQAEAPVERAAADYWLPVDQYIGGIEHAILHLLYARYFTRNLKDLGLTAEAEPFAGLFTQGMVVHETFKDRNGRWLAPEDVTIEADDGKRRAIAVADGAPVTIGPIEKMSKSKKNVVGLDEIVDQYGADTARWFVLSDSPPERDVEWTESGIEGAWRFIHRLWRLVGDDTAALPAPGSPQPAAVDEPALALRRAAHQTLAAVGEAFEALRFNRAIARLHEFANTLGGFKAAADDAAAQWARREALEFLVLMAAPIVPHFAEEAWAALGHETTVVATDWPNADPDLVKVDKVTIAVQVNGKRRDELEVEADADEKAIEEAALALEKVRQALGDKPPRKVIVVKGRIVNVVV